MFKYAFIITLALALAGSILSSEKHMPNMYDFVSVQAINPTISLDIKYAKTTNFTGKIIYPQEGCYLRVPAAYALDAVQKELAPMGLGVKVFDGYRPLRYQQLFWDIMPDERYVAHPKKGSKHNRGAAVDLTLVNCLLMAKN